MSSKASKMKGLLPGGGFKPDKCKASIRMAVARMKLMRNRRDAIVRQVRREVANLLQSGDDSTARIRVDHVIRDEKTIQAYELLEVYCELIIQRLHIIHSQKICPIDLKEPIATVLFAAPRCADVPELSDVSKHFQAKYPKEFIIAARELRPGSGVSLLVVDKLSATSANIETKIKLLKSIAQEHNVNWEAKGFEEDKQLSQLARLDGSSKFLKVSEVETVQPVHVQTPPPVTPSHPQNYAHQNTSAYQPAKPNNYSGISDPPVATSVHVSRSQSGSRNKESKYVSEEENKKMPPDFPYPDGEYTTVEEAAEAAAKSAEMASRAAKAAASMARHGGLSREQSNVSSKSYSTRDSPRKYDMDDVSSKPKPLNSVQISNTPNSQGSQMGHFNPTTDRSSIAPPSPSHSSASSGGYAELDDVTPSLGSLKFQEYSKESSFSKDTNVMPKEEKYGYSVTDTRYDNSSSHGSMGFQEDAIWDDNEDIKHPEYVSSNRRSDSYGLAFDDSRLDTYDRPVYEEESFSQFGRNNSSVGTTWFSSDNISRSQLPKSSSERKNSSSLLNTSNTSEWDPPRSPVNIGSDSNMRSDSYGIAFDDSRLEAYDRPVYEEESFSQFGRNDSSASKRGTPLFSSSDSFSSPQLPKGGSPHKNSFSLLYNSNASERDPPRPPANTGSGTKFDKGLKSTSHGSSFNDERLNLLSVLSGQSLPQSYVEEDSGPKFDNGPNFDSDMLSDDENDKVNPVHVHVEEEKIIENVYIADSSLSSRSHAKERTGSTFTSNSDESRNKNLPQSLRTRNSRMNHEELVQPEITKEPRVKAEETPLRYIPKEIRTNSDDDSGKQQYLDFGKLRGGRRNLPGSTRPPYMVNPLEEEQNPSNSPTIKKPTVDMSVEEEGLYTQPRSSSRESEVRRNRPFRGTNLGNKLSEKKEAYGRSTLHYTPNRKNFDEEETEEDIAQQANIKLKVPSSSRVSDHVALEDDQETEEEVEPAAPANINLKGPSSSTVSKGYLGVSENQLDYQAPLRVYKRVVGNSSRDSLEVTEEVPMEKTEEALSKSSGSRGPLQYVPPREEEEQVRTVRREETASAQPTFPRASFPLDMDALRARVQQIKATMNNT